MSSNGRAPARMKRWVVRPVDGKTVNDILRSAGEDASAIAEGRVFVGKKRVNRVDAPVRVGDEVRIGARTSEGPGERPSNVEVRRIDDGLVACIKPEGIPTVPDHAGAAHALTAIVARTIGVALGDLRVTSRLDRDVSGVVIFAVTEEAERRLRRARDEGRYERRYVAIASRASALDGLSSPWTWPIGRAHDPRLRAVSGPDEKPATTRWRAVGHASDVAVLAVGPETGRTHQIRLHASTAGSPLLGDRDYGGPSRLTLADGRVLAFSRIALHAARVVVPGKDGQRVVVEAPVPEALRRIWAELGGDSEAWDRAVSCDLDA